MVWVRDLETSMDFYKKLGFEINLHSLEEHRAGKIPLVAVKAGPHNQIDLRPNPDWVPVEREKGNMQHINVVVDGITDVNNLVDGLAKQGLTPDYGPEIQGGSWRIDIYDPDNNRIEMALGIPA